jgi:hypothetical protein
VYRMSRLPHAFPFLEIRAADPRQTIKNPRGLAPHRGFHQAAGDPFQPLPRPSLHCSPDQPLSLWRAVTSPPIPIHLSFPVSLQLPLLVSFAAIYPTASRRFLSLPASSQPITTSASTPRVSSRSLFPLPHQSPQAAQEQKRRDSAAARGATNAGEDAHLRPRGRVRTC